MAIETSGIPLNATTVNDLPPDVRVPAYDRRRVKQGIVHLGVGGFHRAHQAVYLDDLLQRPGSEAYGICGVGLLPHDRRMGEVLRAQDYLYTVITRGAAGDRARVVGSIVDFLFAPDDPHTVVERMASTDTKIVSLTVTEAGYYVNRVTGELDDKQPAIIHDLEHPERPVGPFGFLAEALHRRRQRGLPPFTVMSCDNLLNNGALCRRVLLAFITRRDASLADWVARHVAFPNSMVDRITPATTDADREFVRGTFGIRDAWPVMTEPFMQWVVEDHFANGRPAWETVGAQLVSDVEPYEKMKIRLLNGSHQVLCYIGMLMGYRYAPQAMADVQVRSLLEEFMERGVTPLLSPVPGIDLEEYKRTLLVRFANPAINDQLARIGTDGSARVGEFVLPIAAEQLKRGGPTGIAAFTVAAWIRFLAGKDELGGDLQLVDPIAETLRERAAEGGANPSPILSISKLFGEDLTGSPRFVDEVRTALQSFYEQGARATLARCIQGLSESFAAAVPTPGTPGDR